MKSIFNFNLSINIKGHIHNNSVTAKYILPFSISIRHYSIKNKNWIISNLSKCWFFLKFSTYSVWSFFLFQQRTNFKLTTSNPLNYAWLFIYHIPSGALRNWGAHWGANWGVVLRCVALHYINIIIIYWWNIVK